MNSLSDRSDDLKHPPRRTSLSRILGVRFLKSPVILRWHRRRRNTPRLPGTIAGEMVSFWPIIPHSVSSAGSTPCSAPSPSRS